ncbi:ATP synthase F1 subunit delta [Marinilabiliaceae bacterium ANBcel2]|nr:ATP synthase F1 subunit delta [Marinilabiliaceae bacterium ANBcel2]
MNAALLAVRYANALYLYGKDNTSLLDRLYRDCTFLNSAFRESDDLTNFVNNQLIRTEKKIRVLQNIFKDVLHSSTLRFLAVIVENNREAILRSVMINFIDFYRSYKGIKSATVISAVPLNQKFQDYICDIIETALNCKVELECRSNKDLIGGFILRMDGKELDGSVKGELRSLKKQLMIK